MFEELKKINKQYYDDSYNEGNDKKEEETENIMNKENHKETRNQKIMFKVIIFVSVFLISLGIMVLSKTNNRNSEGIVSSETNELRDTLTNETSKNKELIEKVQKRQKELESLKGKLTEKNDIAEGKKKEVLENNMKLGLTNLRPEKIRKKFGNDALQIIVHDTDILEIVNVLRNAGAEAISINDQRIIATTPISCIGTVIKINDEKIGGPYVIRAIGNSDYLKTALDIPGGILKILESSRNRSEFKERI